MLSLYEEWNFADTMTIQQVTDNRSPSMQPCSDIALLYVIISLNAIIT